MTSALSRAIRETAAQVIQQDDGAYYQVDGQFASYRVNPRTNVVQNVSTNHFLCIIDGQEGHTVKTTEDGTIARLYALRNDKQFVNKIKTLTPINVSSNTTIE